MVLQRPRQPTLVLASVFLLLACCAAGSFAQITIPVQNGQFEDTSSVEVINQIPAWTVGITNTRAIVSDVRSKFTSGASANGGPYALVIRKADNVAISQVLNHAIEGGRRYDVTFSAGYQLDANGPMRTFSVQLRRADNDAVLGSRTVSTADNIAPGTWKSFTFSVFTEKNKDYVGKNLKVVIRVVNQGIWVYVDDVSVSYEALLLSSSSTSTSTSSSSSSSSSTSVVRGVGVSYVLKTF